ncbi:MAG: TRAP transporter large permease [Gammaproteobacteria bacterium]|nr:TRAP transporter large permease [Gammaproteobacteria bacterium]
MILAAVACAMLLLMLLTRVPLGFTLTLCGIGGIAAVHPRGLPAALAIAEQQFIDLAFNFQFSALALFLTMGVFVVGAGLADDLFDMSQRWVGHWRGGLAVAAVVTSAGFAAICGSSTAATSTMASVAVPAMRRFNYSLRFSAGTVAAGGTLGILVPPSSALIIYGLLTGTSIDRLFMAALVPAVIQVAAYIIAIAIVARIWPDWAPAASRSSWSERGRALGRVWSVLALFVLIIGGLFAGRFTTTEAGGVGAGGAMLIALLRGRLSRRVLLDGLARSARTIGLIYVVAAGAMVLGQFVNLDGAPAAALEFIQHLQLAPMAVVGMILLLYVVLGLFIDGYAMLFLTVPIVCPVISSMGMDLTWWGIVVIITVEMAMISHPFGLNICIMRAFVPEASLLTIFLGVVPYLLADLARLALVVLLPTTVALVAPLFQGNL